MGEIVMTEKEKEEFVSTKNKRSFSDYRRRPFKYLFY